MADLLEYLVDTRLAGEVATTRVSNHAHAKAFAEGVDAFQFGLPPLEPWSTERVIGVMHERVGIDPDHLRSTGDDVIDPELTLGALERMREHVRLAIEKRHRVMMGTGHPAGIIEVHLALAAALRRAGCEILTPAAGTSFVQAEDFTRQYNIRYLGGVAVVAERGSALRHSHSPVAMQLMLAALEEAGEPMPDLVIADHGFAGAAAAAGLTVVCFADCNDPSLVIGEAEGRVAVTVPIDDNLQPHLYDPVADFLLT
jgi:hypothetical protein